MLRRVECRRVSRWRSRGPSAIITISIQFLSHDRIWGIEDEGGSKRTSNTNRRPYINFYSRFFRLFIAAQDFNGPVDGADDGVRIVSVCCGAVGAVEVGEGYFGEDHGVSDFSCGWYARATSVVDLRILKISKVLVGRARLAEALIGTRLKLACRGASSRSADSSWGVFTSLRGNKIYNIVHIHLYCSKLNPYRTSILLIESHHHGQLLPQCLAHQAPHDRAANIPIRPERRPPRTRPRRRRCNALESRHERRSWNRI